MPAPQFYNERMREQIYREISWSIANRVNDPRIPDIVTITELKLAADTRNATVYVSIMGSDEIKKSALSALNHAAPFIQKCVASRVSMRHIPKLYFKLDTAFDRSEHINSLLEQVKDELE